MLLEALKPHDLLPADGEAWHRIAPPLGSVLDRTKQRPALGRYPAGGSPLMSLMADKAVAPARHHAVSLAGLLKLISNQPLQLRFRNQRASSKLDRAEFALLDQLIDQGSADTQAGASHWNGACQWGGVGFVHVSVSVPAYSRGLGHKDSGLITGS